MHSLYVQNDGVIWPAMRRRPAGKVAFGYLAVVVLLSTGCAAGTSGSGPSWVPQQNFAAENHDPQPRVSVPGNDLPNAAPTHEPQGQSGGSGSASPSPTASGDPTVVAMNLDQPTGLVVMPDGTALVGERATGRILRVQPEPDRPVQLVQTLSGVDGTGDGGLLDLALSPTFDQDGLLYAYLTTAIDNRVVHFVAGQAPTPVITGIPKGARDNAGRIAFDGTGALLTGTGDAGQPALAESVSSLAGKILRTDDVGRPLADNPDPTSPVFASGFRTIDGLCIDPVEGSRIAVSAARPNPETTDEINIVRSGGDYGWPNGSGTAAGPVATLPAAATGAAGCAVTNHQLAIATTSGRALVTGAIAGAEVTQLAPTLVNKYGRLRTVVAGADGSLWLTTSNRDGLGQPTPRDDRVIRLDASVGGSIL